MSLIDTIFDPAYRKGFNPATNDVPLLKVLYLMTIPLAKLLARLNIKPNTITSISNVVALMGIGALIWGENPWVFPALWLAALLFDMADGIVARVTGQSSASGSFYDHMSDQIKVILLFLAVALRYDSLLIWVLVYITNALFLFMGIVNYVCMARTLKLGCSSVSSNLGNAATPAVTAHKEISSGGVRGVLKRFFMHHPRLKKWALGAFASVFVMYGNSMVLLLPLSFGKEWAIATLLLFSLITFRSLVSIMRMVVEVNRGFGRAGTSWK